MKQVLESLGFEDVEVLERRVKGSWVLVVIAFAIFSMVVHPGTHLDHALRELLAIDWT